MKRLNLKIIYQWICENGESLAHFKWILQFGSTIDFIIIHIKHTFKKIPAWFKYLSI